MFYWIYCTIFSCCRRVDKLLFRDDSQPLQTLTVTIPVPDYPWLSITAIRGDTEIDVTDLVNSLVTPGHTVTPKWLSTITNEADVEKWEYIDSLTFDVHEIPSDGLVNEVKSKSD